MKKKRLFCLSFFLTLFITTLSLAADLEIHVINVDQGDSFLIISPSGKRFLIDAGNNGKGTSRVLPYLNSLGITSLDYSLASHYHADHIGGLDEVINGLGGNSHITTAAYDRGGSYSSLTYTDYVNSIGDKRTTITVGQIIDIGDGASIECIASDGYIPGSKIYFGTDENTLSIVLILKYKAFQMYFGGDSTSTIESYLTPYTTDVDVYKVSHHGSDEGSSQTILDVLKPEVSVIPVGDGNSYGHPSSDTITKLVNINSYIYQTETGATAPPSGKGEIANGNFKIVTDGYYYTISGSSLTTITRQTDEAEPNPYISLDRNKLNFGAILGSSATRSQTVLITRTGSGALNWTVTPNQSWIKVNPLLGTGTAIIDVSVDPSGLGEGTYSGTIYVADPDALQYLPKTVTVSLKVYGIAASNAPFGYFDTPTDSSIVSGSIPVTGWALDDVEVKRIEIKRDPDSDDPPAAIGSDGLVYVGDAIFVKGARTDVEALYPNYPLCDRGGWGYMMLVFGLPRRGNGTFRIHAFAEDVTGKRTLLGIKKIIADNAHRTNPFGTIDTPGQGETISGSAYISFGWAITPPPNMIPTDGSTVWLSIDSVFIGHPVYNNYRADIAQSFPEYLNANGAVGYFYLDTTSYTNGVHTIGWFVVDNVGNADGMGSRFIEIQNLGSSSFKGLEHLKYMKDLSGKLKIKVAGDRKIETEELERIELVFVSEGANHFIGWGKDESKPLPIGSTLDKENGIFYWAPGPGFLGKHILHFAVTNGIYMSKPVEIEVNIIPKRYTIDTKKRKSAS